MVTKAGLIQSSSNSLTVYRSCEVEFGCDCRLNVLLIFKFLSLIMGVSDKSTSLCSVGQAQEENLSAPITLMNSRICQAMKTSK